MSSLNEFVDKEISSHKVIVFSKTYCPYCHKAKNVLNKYKINDIKIIELDDMDNGDQIQEYLGKITGAKTVPRVFINGNCIGGGDDTVRLDDAGKLQPLLEECNAIEVASSKI